MKLYISGPITGMADSNRQAFSDAAVRLVSAGYRVVNPQDIGFPSGYQGGLKWADYLRADLIHILTCGVQGIATLDGHHNSRGAQLECHLAAELDLPVGPEAFWLSIKRESF